MRLVEIELASGVNTRVEVDWHTSTLTKHIVLMTIFRQRLHYGPQPAEADWPKVSDMDLLALTFKSIAGLGITATVAAAAAYAAFQFLGKKWLDARFAERLEKFKHDQNQEIERLRFRINALMDRTAKLHQHEFEVLPEVWDKLGIAFAAASNFTRITSYPDLDSMGAAQYSEFLEASGLFSWQKDELQQCSDRNDRYREMMFWHRLHDVKTSHADFHNYFIFKGIFIQPS